MANATARLLRLLSLLQHHRFWPGGELAARLEVSARTLRRDIDRLRDLGYPVQAVRGVAGGYQLRSGAAMPPLVVDDDEAVAIAVSLRAAAGGVVGGVAETSVRALTKVLQVLPPRLRRRMEALQAYTVPPSVAGPTVDAAALTTIAQACRDAERLRFSYTARDGEQSTRLVEPHALVPLGRRWYLVAWDTDRHDWRTFRLDRLSNPVGTGARFRPRELPAPDAASFVRDRLDTVPARYQVVVDIRAPAATVAREVAEWGEVRARGDGGCRLLMSVDTLDWPAMVLGAVGAEFQVVAPPELRDQLRRVGELLRRGADRPGCG